MLDVIKVKRVIANLLKPGFDNCHAGIQGRQ